MAVEVTFDEQLVGAPGSGATWAQTNVLDALRRVTADGWPATVREVARAAGLASPSTAHAHLYELEKAGLARKHPRNQAGGWRLS